MKVFVAVLLTLMSLAVASQQYYDDYGDDVGGDYYQQQDYGGDYYGDDGADGPADTLYSDYAKHQEQKAMGVKGGLSPMVKNVAIGATSWFLGAKFHSRRAVKKSEKNSVKAHQKLYERYVKDVSALQLQNAQLQEYIQQSTIQQLTEEFLQADTNNDRKVSRLEFERYKADYLKKHPEADPSMFPRFEDFDPDHNGMVTLKEHEDYYRNQGMIA
eukprot:jgi/Psemu1/244941/estExt_Genewise1.C_5130013